MKNPSSAPIRAAADYVKRQISGEQPVIGIVLGSGLGKLTEQIEHQRVIPYSSIPDFPVSTAIGHAGNFIAGALAGKRVIAMQGRLHYYEGYDIFTVVLPIRVMALLGIRYLFISNAAGGVNPAFREGDLMIITDQINLIPNPLIGPNMDEFGPRFPDMTRPYDPKLIEAAEKAAARLRIEVCRGVYLGCTGPSYETPAEYRYFRTIGADAVGMSTTPEVIVARHSGIPVFGMSVITDVVRSTEDETYVTDGAAIVAAADAAADRMSSLFSAIVETI